MLEEVRGAVAVMLGKKVQDLPGLHTVFNKFDDPTNLFTMRHKAMTDRDDERLQDEFKNLFIQYLKQDKVATDRDAALRGL